MCLNVHKTIGLSFNGVLCILGKKYIVYVKVSVGKANWSCVCMSMALSQAFIYIHACAKVLVDVSCRVLPQGKVGFVVA